MVKWLSKITPILFVALLTSYVAVQPASCGGVLRIGITADYPPLIFKAGEEIKGAEADFGNLLAKELKRTPQFIELLWEELIPALIGEKDRHHHVRYEHHGREKGPCRLYIALYEEWPDGPHAG
ncbi:MAG TPA: transporter substrate-binding domain-containing protein [Thermodesulfobacteriota bacterium]|nr:transporter substrate-binding domain-containing protein [Thermodesulfobacteriota bacterium]